MGEVIPLFRDRRKGVAEHPSTAEVDVTFTRNSLHDHMQGMHGWGGPKGTSRADLDRIHEDSHRDPPSWWKPHRHV